MTLALQVELLGGRYVATAYNDREAGEWPPHPARLFSALVEAWASGEPGSGEGEEERMALVWLERQAPPSIAAAGLDEIGRRSAATVFVPVNDIAVVRDPDSARAKLEEAEAALSEGNGDEKAAAKAKKDVEKLRKKLSDDTAKALAAPAKVSDSDLVAADRLFPEQRTKQARMFPSVTPEDPIVTFCWEGTPETPLRAALARLTSRLTRLGHSSSMVFARLVEAAPAPRYVPDADGELVLRAVGAGQMDRLIASHHQHQGVEPRVLPCSFVRYREGGEAGRRELARSAFSGDWMVFAREQGPRLPSTSAVGVATQLRRALFAAGKAPMSEALSGHREDGSATEGVHLAVVPLPDVGGEYSHGGILGIALVLPPGLSEADRATLMRAIGELERTHGSSDPEAPSISLMLGKAGVLQLGRVRWGESASAGLRPGTWCRASRDWGTATPIALHRNPGNLHDEDPRRRAKAFEEATALVAEAVGWLGLPEPQQLDVLRSCVVPGTEKPHRFPRYPISTERPQRVMVHARIRFAEPVRGPLLLGAGRYVGLGLCRPLDERPGRGPYLSEALQ